MKQLHVGVGRLQKLLNRWEVMTVFPLIVIASVAYGGDAVLWACAVALPTLMALKSWAMPADANAPDPHVKDTRIEGRPVFLRAADDTLALCAETKRVTAVLTIQIDSSLLVEGEWRSDLSEDVIERIQQRIGVTVRGNDIVARCGETVFGVLLHPVPRADLEITLSIIDRLQAAIAEPLSMDGVSVYVNSAIGLCLQERSPALNGAAFVAAAECAMRAARRSEEGGVRAFTPEMQQQTEVEHQLAGQVLGALDSGDIRPWFQPQVSTDDGKISGFEALARWHHPDLGLLSPAQFLPAVAAGHAFVQLGETILLHSLKALQSWDRAGICVPNISINLSLDELRDPRLADRIIWQVDRFDLRNNRLCIEILETVTLKSDDDAVMRNLRALRAAGFRMDLDDFGTGHASIAHIAQFGVNRIKIDRSFVTGIDHDPGQKRLVAAILSMADQLGVETLAEGVETPGEHSALAQLGCEHVQGYGISKPIPFEDTVGWITAHNAKIANTDFRGRKLG